MAQEIDNTQDIMDSRDVIARIEELESEFETLTEAVDEAREELQEAEEELNEALAQEHIDVSSELERRDDAKNSLEIAESNLADCWDEDVANELKILKAFADEAEGYGDWDHGETLIHEDYFTEYAQELAEDCCDIPRDLKWPFTCIDWEQAAEELKQDYTTAEFDGVTYYLRA